MSSNSTNQAFQAFYLQHTTAELAEDLDQLRTSADFVLPGQESVGAGDASAAGGKAGAKSASDRRAAARNGHVLGRGPGPSGRWQDRREQLKGDSTGFCSSQEETDTTRVYDDDDNNEVYKSMFKASINAESNMQ
ncbi:uncharacterized protein SPSK_00623 [Sporothrix schenckii 1099-18]|uniref:Ribosome-assembly protein 3 C-terminal domain-containing protein n=1 Tax=Sporothrix schenckii 1099-18 TaxID=1397361 RepID=A0A0F2LU45_SPOSC|nr:uncharacterized protein SPSK_00623 [Sporothrix schenckii 1099-18]KJR80030.1 hypothetical protein SPSK_00623 [Sporothrix schenckii 1099-18]